MGFERVCSERFSACFAAGARSARLRAQETPGGGSPGCVCDVMWGRTAVRPYGTDSTIWINSSTLTESDIPIR